MRTPSKVLVVSGDRPTADAMRKGFEREALSVSLADTHDEAVALFDDIAVVIAAPGAGRAEPERFIADLIAVGSDRGSPPLLYVGNDLSRVEALAAGATAVLASPAFVRDVVTIGRILAGRRPGNRSIMDGNLGENFGVFYLVRALCATSATGTLQMLRGLRRGEIRFFEGEVTSAQVGGMHGQAALHQLLLWTEARIELRNEPVVRRQQIPLSLDELLSHASQFLSDLREVAGNLSPAHVYEPDASAMESAGKGLPSEVQTVLKLFDGYRTVADVLEDSPFRVLETVRMAEQAARSGLIRQRAGSRPRVTHRGILTIDEWLVGGGSVERPVNADSSGSVSSGERKAYFAQAQAQAKKGKSDSKPRGAVSEVESTVEVDWRALVPRSAGFDAGRVSPVVPASAAQGEIEVTVRPSRGAERERLESVTDAGTRERLFSGELSVSVIVGLAAEEGASPVAERERLEPHNSVEMPSSTQPPSDGVGAAIEAAQSASPAEIEAATGKVDRGPQVRLALDDEEHRAVTAARATLEAAWRVARAKAARAKFGGKTPSTDADVAALASLDDEVRAAKADAEVLAKREAEVQTARARARAKRDSGEQATQAKREAAEAQAKREAVEAQAKREAAEAQAKQEAAEAQAKQEAAEAQAKREAAEAQAKREAAEAQAKREAAEAQAKQEAAEAQAKQEAAEAQAKREAAEAQAKREAAEAQAKQEAAEAQAKQEAAEAQAKREAAEAQAKQEAAEAHEVLKQHGGLGEHRGGEGEPRRERRVSGEIVAMALRGMSAEPDMWGPSIAIDDLVETRRDATRVAGAAISAAVAVAYSPAPTDVAKLHGIQSAGAEASAARRDAQKLEAFAVSTFSDDEEAFFTAGHDGPHGPPVESFADLDEGYQPQTFWDRLLGRSGKSKGSTRTKPTK